MPGTPLVQSKSGSEGYRTKGRPLQEFCFSTAISKRFSCLINVLQVATITRLIGNCFEVVLEYFHFQTLKFQCSICNFTVK